MNNKAYVNQTVADLIESAKLNGETKAAQLSWIYNNITDEFLSENGVSMTEITKAVENGYEIVFVYKPKDIVKIFFDNTFTEVVEMNGGNAILTIRGVFFQNEIELVTHACDRKDTLGDE